MCFAWPIPSYIQIVSEANDKNALSPLWCSKIRTIYRFEPYIISKIIISIRFMNQLESMFMGYPVLVWSQYNCRMLKLQDDIFKVRFKAMTHEAANVFQQYRRRREFTDRTEGMRKHIAPITVASMFSAYREWL